MKKKYFMVKVDFSTERNEYVFFRFEEDEVEEMMSLCRSFAKNLLSWARVSIIPHEEDEE